MRSALEALMFCASCVPRGYDDASLSEWHAACTSGGSYDYPYGNELDTTICRGGDAEDYTTWGLGDVGSFSGCHSPDDPYGGADSPLVHSESGSSREKPYRRILRYRLARGIASALETAVMFQRCPCNAARICSASAC